MGLGVSGVNVEAVEDGLDAARGIAKQSEQSISAAAS